MPSWTSSNLFRQRELYKDITTGEITHTTVLDNAGIADYRSVIGYFAQTIMRELKLFSGYEVLHPKVKSFVANYLFDRAVELEDANTLRNLSEIEAARTILETFKKAINELTVKDKGDAKIRDYIKLRQTRPFVVKDQAYLVPRKSVFNRIIGDSHLELLFARFLDDAEDVASFTKNFYAVNFKLDYINADGDISHYIPDFIVKSDKGEVFVIETKGLEDLDDPLKIARLSQWCDDINGLQSKVKYDFVYVDEEGFLKYHPSSLKELVSSFREHKTE
jgi:type III restriction enzyme